MKVALYAHTHGIGYRDDVDLHARSVEFSEMQPLRVARLAEAQGFHSMWFPDHVCMPIASDSAHTANASGTRAYSASHNMLDAQITMASVAAVTTTLRLGTTCLIAPYRHPLSDARQLSSIDVLSGGRLMVGVAAGWMAEEYTALGLDIAERNSRLEECIEIYKRSWLDPVVSFSGEHYSFAEVSMDPKPLQNPRPPIMMGATTPAGARRAARVADGLYPLFLDPSAKPDRYSKLQDEVRRELDRNGRNGGDFSMLCAVSGRLVDSGEAAGLSDAICTGSAEQILQDLERFAANGYSLAVLGLDIPSGTLAELEEQIQRFGEAVIPEAEKITTEGEWQPVD